MSIMQHHDPPQNLEMSLREQLLAAGSSGQPPQHSHSPYPPPPTAGAPGPDHPYQTSDVPSPQAHPHDSLDPNVAHQQQAPYAHMSGDSAGDDGLSPQGSKAKRELSTSKRAAQNRAAQRAFRQRKEGYIKKLEEQVKEFQIMENNYRSLQSENYQLREYILNLQSRLLESSSDIPPAPSQVNLQHSHSPSGLAGPGAGRAPPPPPPPSHQPAHGESLEHRYSTDPREQPTALPPMAATARRDDPMSHLQAAAAQADAASRSSHQQQEQQQHESPYGLGAGGDYGVKRPRLGDGPADAKAAS